MAVLGDAPPEIALPAAGVLAALQYDAKCLGILARFAPAAHEEILSIAMRVVPRITPGDRAGAPPVDNGPGRGVARLQARRAPGAVSSRASRRRPLEIVAEAIRGGKAGGQLHAADTWWLDAEADCWTGDYAGLRDRLAERPFGGDTAAGEIGAVAGDR